MSKVVREDIDNLNAVVTVTLEKSDYEPKFKSELKKISQKSNMKGFRKGQTPITMIKKMYGKSVLGDVINDKISEKLSEYLKENEVAIFGQPLPSKDQKPLEFDLKNLTEYEFKFDLGLEPEFEIKGIDSNSSYLHYVVDIPEEDIDKEIENARKRFGERTNPTDDILENDIVKLAAIELKDGEIKDDAIETEFSLLVDTIADEDVKKELLTKKAGDVIRFNIYKLEKEREDANDHRKYVEKHLIKLPEDHEGEVGEMFEASISEISRVEPAPLEQKFFDEYFGEGKVSNEVEARGEVKQNIAKFYNNQADAILFRNLQKEVVDSTEIPLPEAFLKRWMQATNENMTMDKVEKEFESFGKAMGWSLIKNRIAKEHNVQVTDEDVKEQLRSMVMSMYGGQMAAYADMFIENMLKDEQQVNRAVDRASDEKVFKIIKDQVTLQDSTVTIEEFQKIIQDINAEIKAQEEANAPVIASDEEE